MAKIKKNYLKAIVMVHGKSELQICSFIKSNLKIKLEIESDRKGEKSIQITSIMNRLNGKQFKEFDYFKNKFDDIEYKGKRLLNFCFFIIMDTDDCNNEQKLNFLNKNMFKNHWLYDYIFPIYNSPNLEKILKKAKVPFKSKKESNMKKEYVELFPISKSSEVCEKVQIEELIKKLEVIEETNMEQFFKYCLDIAK